MDTYMLNYECSNCWAGFLVETPFGHEALQNLRCPNCGNPTVSKTKKEINIYGRYIVRNEQLEEAAPHRA